MSERFDVAARYIQHLITIAGDWGDVGRDILKWPEHDAAIRNADRLIAKASKLGVVPSDQQAKFLLASDPVVGDFTSESVTKYPTSSIPTHVVRMKYGRDELIKLRAKESALIADLAKSTLTSIALAPEVIRALVFGVDEEE